MSTTTGTDTGTGKTPPGRPAGRPFIPTSSGRRTKALIAKLLVTVVLRDRASCRCCGCSSRSSSRASARGDPRQVVDPIPAGSPA